MSFFSDLYGAYPFEAAGGIIDPQHDVGYSLETQTKPVYAYVPDEITVVHELSHMWFGDAVTLTRVARHLAPRGVRDVLGVDLDRAPRRPDRTADVRRSATRTTSSRGARRRTRSERPSQMFSTPVYDRGGMTLQALRVKVGDATFFRILRDWYAQNRYKNVSTPQFIALAEAESGQDLDAFFQAWLYTPEKPTSW